LRSQAAGGAASKDDLIAPWPGRCLSLAAARWLSI